MVDYVIYAAYAEERDLFFLYKDLRERGCAISRYRAEVPGQARLRTVADRNPTGLLGLHDGELAIVNTPNGKNLNLKEIIDKHCYPEIVDVLFSEMRK